MSISNTIKTDIDNIDQDNQPPAEMFELSRTQLAQILKQGNAADHDLAELVYEVATQVVREHGRQVQLFLVMPE
jgi:hypothetical protein